MRFILILLIIFSPSISYAASSRTYGNNDFLDMGDVFDAGVADTTVCSYVNTTEDASSDFIIGKKDGITSANAGYGLYQSTADVITFLVSDGTDIVSSVATTDTDGTWVMACGTWNGATEVTAVYINGTQEDTDTGAGLVGTLNNGISFTVGADAASNNDPNSNMAYSLSFPRVLTNMELLEIIYRPDHIVENINGFWTHWGDSPEINIATLANNGAVTGAGTSNTSGPPIIIGDAPL